MRLSRYEPFLEVYEMELMDYFDIRKLRMKGSSFCQEKSDEWVENVLFQVNYGDTCVLCRVPPVSVFTVKRNQNEIIYSQWNEATEMLNK